jgi:type VI secretion system protein ImpH
MGPADGRKSAALSEQLLGEPYRFDFFQAVRLLERLARQGAGHASRRPRQPVGQDHPPDQEFVRFRALPGLSFPAGSVSQIQQPAADGAVSAATSPALEMVVACLGLTGPQGVLPQHYSTLLLQRSRVKDFALRDFLDLFNHRTISFFYRAWEKYRLPFAYERSRLGSDQEKADLVSWCLYCLAGLGTAGLRGRLDVDDEAFLFYSGHFAHFPRSAVTLEALLEDYFESPVGVQQAQGRWLVLEPGDRSLLPSASCPAGQHAQLGLDTIVGERVWDVQTKFRVRMGPLSYRQFRRFMPSGEGLRALGQMTRTYVGPELEFDVQLVLAAPEVPACLLSEGSTADQPRLGWNTWVKGAPLTEDASDAVFSWQTWKGGDSIPRNF